MAEDENISINGGDFDSIESEFHQILSGDENKSNLEGAVKTGPSSGFRKGNKESKKRVKAAHQKRAEALKITRPAFMNTIKRPNLGDTIETSMEGDTATPTGEFSSAMPSNVRNIRQTTANQTALNPGRNRFNLLGNDSNIPAMVGNKPSIIGGMAGALDFVNSNSGQAQDLGMARRKAGAGDTPSDNNTDLGKHLVQIWEHIRDTLDDIKDLLKESGTGHQTGRGVAMPGIKSEENNGPSLLDGLIKAFAPLIALLGAGLVSKFGPVVAGVTSNIKKFSTALEDAGKNIDKHFGDLGKTLESLKNGMGGLLENIGKFMHIPNPIKAAQNTVIDAIHASMQVAPRTTKIVGRAVIAGAEAAGKIGRGVAGGVTNVAKTVTGLGLRAIGGTAKTLLKPLNAGVGAFVGYDIARHGLGAIHDLQSGNQPGFISNTERTAADVLMAGGPKNTVGLLADAASMVPYLGKPVAKGLNKFANSKDGKLFNSVIKFGLRQTVGRVMGAVGGVAAGGAMGGGWEDLPADIAGGVTGFIAPQIAAHELNRSANWIDRKYNKNFKPEAEKAWAPDKHIGVGWYDKMVDGTNFIGSNVNKVIKPLDSFTDKVAKPFLDKAPSTWEGVQKLAANTTIPGLGMELGKNLADYIKNAQKQSEANNKAIVATLTAQLSKKSSSDSASGHTQTISFNFNNPQINNQNDARKLIDQAIKALRAQDQLSNRATERFSNLGLPAQTQPLPMS